MNKRLINYYHNYLINVFPDYNVMPYNGPKNKRKLTFSLIKNYKVIYILIYLFDTFEPTEYNSEIDMENLVYINDLNDSNIDLLSVHFVKSDITEKKLRLDKIQLLKMNINESNS